MRVNVRKTLEVLNKTYNIGLEQNSWSWGTKNMEENIIPVEAIRERDIDLILLEELTVNSDFREWFINNLDLPTNTSWLGVWRSITDFGLGETDILLSYYSGQRKILVLVENKLDASFQDEQHGRYQRRASQYVETGKCSEAYAVLVAPNQYCGNQNEFESFISYEQIGAFFESSGSIRGSFKGQLIRIAVEKLRRGYQPVNSEPVQKFWREYWQYREQHYPYLQMKKPDIVPDNSDWPMLHHKDLTSVTFRHKLAQGNVDATFRDLGDAAKKEIKKMLPAEIKMVEHTKTFSLRIFSGKVDRRKEFSEQVNTVDQGLRAIEKLTFVIMNHHNLLLKTYED